MPDADDFPVFVKDSYGEPVRVDVMGPEVVLDDRWIFGADAFENLSQVLIAARHVADRAVSSDG